MDNPGTSSSVDDSVLCKLCNTQRRQYCCPRCGINYCSAECYKSPLHSQCSESFYKQCVEEELSLQQNDPELKQKTLDMLQRIHEDNANDDLLETILNDDELEQSIEFDSDDENVPELNERLANINLDDPDELWSALTESERQEFEATINSGEVTKLLPIWVPWWTHKVEKKLVEDLSKEPEVPEYVKHCPKLIDVPMISAVMNASPSVVYNIVNVIYAYAYMVLHFYGDHINSPLEAVSIFLRFCDNIRDNRVFNDHVSAVENVLLQITNCEALHVDQETIISTKQAGDCIIEGPEEKNRTYYAKAALSDLYDLLTKAKEEISHHKSTDAKDDFRKKFQPEINLDSAAITKKNLQLYAKKLEYYLSWLQSKELHYNLSPPKE